ERRRDAVADHAGGEQGKTHHLQQDRKRPVEEMYERLEGRARKPELRDRQSGERQDDQVLDAGGVAAWRRCGRMSARWVVQGSIRGVGGRRRDLSAEIEGKVRRDVAAVEFGVKKADFALAVPALPPARSRVASCRLRICLLTLETAAKILTSVSRGCQDGT